MSGIVRSRFVSLISKSHRLLCSKVPAASQVSGRSHPYLQHSTPPPPLPPPPPQIETPIQNWIQTRTQTQTQNVNGNEQTQFDNENDENVEVEWVVRIFGKRSDGLMSKLFSSIARFFNDLRHVGLDKAGNSYITLRGERWVVFKDDDGIHNPVRVESWVSFKRGDDIYIPVEWIHWLSWKREEAPTPEEQEASHKIIGPSELLDHGDFGYENCDYRLKAMSLSKDAMFLTIEGFICDYEDGQLYLFAVKKKLGEIGGPDMEISSELNIRQGHFFDLWELVDGLASKRNPLISDKLEEESPATKGVRSPEATGVVPDETASRNEFFDQTSFLFYFEKLSLFQASRAT